MRLQPISCGHGLTIGGGAVWPEASFTLPAMPICAETMSAVRRQFCEMATSVLRRAVALHLPAVVLEFEHLFELILNPAWRAAITADLKQAMNETHARTGLRSVLRVTVADIREQERPPHMRSGAHIQTMLEAFDACAAGGANIAAARPADARAAARRRNPAWPVGRPPTALIARLWTP